MFIMIRICWAAARVFLNDVRRLSRCKRTLSRAPGAESCNQQAWDLESRQRAFKIDRDQGLSGYDGLRFSRNYTLGLSGCPGR